MTTYSVVGKPVTREDGPEKVSGKHLYSADIILPGMIWGKVLRCPYPHAKILSIDTTEAARQLVGASKEGPEVSAGQHEKCIRQFALSAVLILWFPLDRVATGQYTVAIASAQ